MALSVEVTGLSRMEEPRRRVTGYFCEKKEYRRNRHFLKFDAIANDLGEIREITKRVAPMLFNRTTLSEILHQRKRASIPLYSLLGMLGGVDLKSLFDLACGPNIGKTPYAILTADRNRFRKAKGPARLEEVKVRLRKYLAENSDVSRAQLRMRCAPDAIYAMRNDPVWYATKMPWPLKGFKIGHDWAVRDKHFHRRLREVSGMRKCLSRMKRVGAKTVLRLAGMPAFLLINARGRLPKTLRLVNSLIQRPDGSFPFRSDNQKKRGLRCM